MEIQISQIFTQIIAFLIMLWIMKKFAWKPFLAILESRQQKIQAEFDSIEVKKKEVASLFKTYEEKSNQIEQQAKKKLQEAVELGTERAKEIEQNAHEKAQHILTNAKTRAEGERAKMETQIKEEIITISAKMAEAILKEKMDGPLQNKIVKNFAEKVEF